MHNSGSLGFLSLIHTRTHTLETANLVKFENLKTTISATMYLFLDWKNMGLIKYSQPSISESFNFGAHGLFLKILIYLIWIYLKFNWFSWFYRFHSIKSRTISFIYLNRGIVVLVPHCQTSSNSATLAHSKIADYSA